METVLAVVVGGLFASGIYLMLRRSVVKLIIGLGLVGHAFNLLIFTVGGLHRGEPPLVPAAKPIAAAPPEDRQTAAEAGRDAAEQIANPLPQALILTAIVIGFAIQAFAMVLGYRTVQAVGRDDLDLVGEKNRDHSEPTPADSGAGDAFDPNLADMEVRT